MLSESSKQRKQRGQQQTRKQKGLDCLQFLAREKRGGLAACLLGICVIGEGGVVALSEADLVIRLSRARLGVLRLGHVVACVRITSHEILRDGVRAAAAFLLRRPHRAGFLSGSFSSFPRIWLASLIQHKTGLQMHPGVAPGAGWGPGWTPAPPQLTPQSAARCRWVPAPAPPPEGRLS